MSFVFKSIEPSHITINPFYANKLWDLGTITIADLTAPSIVSGSVVSDASMSIYFGRKNTSSWNPAITPEERTNHFEYTRGVWNSINNLFYASFSAAPLDYFAQGVDYFESRSLGDTIQVWSLPQQIIGKGIQRGSLIVNGTITDDSNGNLIDGSGNYVGNVIYNMGLIIWTQTTYTSTACAIKGMTFRSTRLINSYEVICISEVDEHNISDNPSLLAIQSTAQNPGIGPNEPGTYNNDGECYAFVTGSIFSPYITSVGLYNDQGDLLAVGKVPRAVKKALNCDTIFVVRWDA